MTTKRSSWTSWKQEIEQLRERIRNCLHNLPPESAASELQAITAQVTGNPLYLWSSLSYALQRGAPIPVIVRDYLQDCSHALLDKKCGSPEQIAKALKLNKRGPSYVTQYWSRDREDLAALAYLFGLPGYETQEAAAEAACIEPRTLARVLKRELEHYKRIADSLVQLTR